MRGLASSYALLPGGTPRGVFAGRVATRAWRRRMVAAATLVVTWRWMVERLREWPLERPRLFAGTVWERAATALAEALAARASGGGERRVPRRSRAGEVAAERAKAMPSVSSWRSARGAASPKALPPVPAAGEVERTWLERLARGPQPPTRDSLLSSGDPLLQTEGPLLQTRGPQLPTRGPQLPSPSPRGREGARGADLVWPQGFPGHSSPLPRGRGPAKSLPPAVPYAVPSIRVVWKESLRTAAAAFSAPLPGVQAPRALLESFSFPSPGPGGAAEGSQGFQPLAGAAPSAEPSAAPAAVPHTSKRAVGCTPNARISNFRTSNVPGRLGEGPRVRVGPGGAVEGSRELQPLAEAAGTGPTSRAPDEPPSFLPRTVAELERCTAGSSSSPTPDLRRPPSSTKSSRPGATLNGDADLGERIRRLLADEARRHGIEV